MSDNPKQFNEIYQLLSSLGLNQAASIQQLLDGPFEKYKDTWSTLSYLGLDCRENAQRILTNPQSFEQDFDGLIALRSAYESIVKEMEANQLKAHGLAGGNPIKFKGEIRIVPQGVYHIWREMTDSEGKFKWPSDVCAAINRSKVQAEQRKDYRGLTAVSLFFGSYRDTHTKALYSQISQGFKT